MSAILVPQNVQILALELNYFCHVSNSFYLLPQWELDVTLSSFLQLLGSRFASILHVSYLFFHRDENTASNSAAIHALVPWTSIRVAKERGQLVFMAHVVHLVTENIDHYGCSLVGIHVGHCYSYYGSQSTPSPDFFIFQSVFYLCYTKCHRLNIL